MRALQISTPKIRTVLAATVAFSGLVAMTGPVAAAGWYVDGLNGGRYNAGTAASPYLYLWQAVQKVQPGDTIYIMPTTTYSQLGLTANGTPTAQITLAGSDPNNPTKVSGGGVNSGIWINGNYITVRGFDVTAPGPYPAISLAPNHHHITVASNIAHDAGGNGINVFADDYITISHNVVYGNAKNTSQAFGSGISILGSVDIDGNTGVKMIVDGNITYSNTNTPNCSTQSCYASATDSDGSGIILDDNQRQRFDNVPYQGGFLISNNVSYMNGGRGIHVYKSDNATVTNNTMWSNNQDPYESFWHPGEVSAVQAGNVAVYNNILQSDGLASPIHSGTAPNTHVSVVFENCTDGRGPLVAMNNLGYNPQKDSTLFSYVQNNTNPVTISSNKFSGPKLENPNQGDFRVGPTSPALGAANVSTSVATDLLGVSRMPSPSIGAYQLAGP